MKKVRAVLSTMLLLGACDAAEDVDVLPLPPLERPSREARLGLPELTGTWHFAGWEIVQGDSTALERTFPSFGALNVTTQRLDSVAGSFALAGGVTPVVGEVRRDGWVALVTMMDGTPGAYLAGIIARDTLWLELTSIMAANEWPRDARAAFVREGVARPLTWFRGYRPGQIPGAPDTLGIGASLADTTGAEGPGRDPDPGASSGSPGVSGDGAAPAPPPPPAPRPPPPPPPPPPPLAPPPVVTPGPEAVPEEEPPPRMPRLLGEPIPPRQE